MRRTAIITLVVACGHAPPKPPPPAEKAVTGFADVAGSWVTDDDMGWFYTLAIDDKGAMIQTIDRGRLAQCEQKGKLTAQDNPKALQLVYAKDTCAAELGDPDKQDVKIVSFTGDHLTLSFGTLQRAYKRDPKTSGASQAAPH